jgi:hypothetical protein
VEAAGIEGAQPEQSQETSDGVSLAKPGTSAQPPDPTEGLRQGQEGPDCHTVTEHIREALRYLEEGRIDLARLALNSLLKKAEV